MNRIWSLVGAVVVTATLNVVGQTVRVVPTLAPNVLDGSPFYNDWLANELYALEHKLTSYGDPTKPSYFWTATPVLPVTDIAVTPAFNSWRGFAYPGTLFGADFANEKGTRLHWGLHILGNGRQFAAADISMMMFSTDPSTSLTNEFTGYPYRNDYIGIDYGPDRVKGTSDDVRITSGPNTQLVDEYIGRGSGNAYAISLNGGEEPQDAIYNDLAPYLAASPFTFTATYTVNGRIGIGAVTFIPEPSSIALFALGGLGLVGLTLRRRR